jgi:hypothetical protein
LSPPPKWGAKLGKALIEVFGSAPGDLAAEKLANMKDTADKMQSGLLLGEVAPDVVIRVLEEERRLLVANLRSLSFERDLYAQILKTLIVAYQARRQGANAAARMTEYVQAFMDRPLTADSASPPVLKLYQEVLAKLPRGGGIRVETAGRVFVNGMPAPTDRVLALSPGDYAVFVTTSAGDSRVHPVTVRREEMNIRLDIPFEVALSTDSVVGLRFESTKAQEDLEGEYVKKIAGAMRFDEVYVLSQTMKDGAPALRLRAYRSGEPMPAESSLRLGGVVGAAQAQEMAKVLAQKMGAKPALASPDQGRTETQKHRNTEASLEERPPPRQEAWDAYVRGRYHVALETAEKAVAASRSKHDREQLLRVMGGCLCFLKRRDQLRAVWRQLDKDGREFVGAVCGRTGVTTPP